MTKEQLAKAYHPKDVEQKWYNLWQKRQVFSPIVDSDRESFAIVMPPPNVTGVLHMGHALVSTLQDVIVRWQRMLGKKTLWIPGTDHAGIATQTVVEQRLLKEEGKRRKEIGREAFLDRVWRWKEQSHRRITDQLKSLGCSCDWSRERFTMDADANRSVRVLFKKLYDEGLIYRGDYLVNWDPLTQTALADDEVEYEERKTFLWYIRYPLVGEETAITIATTRPEVMLADVAVAVSPRDERYRHLIGKKLHLPLTNREIPILADHFVDPAFGTGAVKITPAHDPNDYQIALRHKLELINILTPDARLNEVGKEFEGLTVDEAREAVTKKLKELGLLVKVEPHVQRVGTSYRSKAVIEPYLSKQWFIRMDHFAPRLRSIVEKGEVKLFPKHWEKVYFHWIDNLRDWCISRQLWWGHRIPIWYRVDNPEICLCYDGEGLPPAIMEAPEKWRQEEDVLDTWFSSALWPFSTLGWPENSADLANFYPNSLLVTGHDILFFWVARMICMGEYATKKAPFPQVFLHGLIYGKSYWRDSPEGISYVSEEERKSFDLGKTPPKEVKSRWEKMSKSKGNIIDPLEVIDEYGADAMRMALCASATQARQIDLDRRRFEEFKNFANKVWNGARFIFMHIDDLDRSDFKQGLDEEMFTLEDKWILSALCSTVRDVSTHLSAYSFDQAAMAAYDFFWKRFCAFYLEIVKPVLFAKSGSAKERLNKQKLLVVILSQSLRLLHPMAPFITEELFQHLKDRFDALPQGVDLYTAETLRAMHASCCASSSYPKVLRESDFDLEINDRFELIERVVYAVRNIRGEMQIPLSMATDVYIIGQSVDTEVLEKSKNIIEALVRIGQLHILPFEPSIGFSSTAVVGNVKIAIPLPKDFLEKEQLRLSKEITKLTLSVEKLEKQLQNSEFIQKAPPALLERQRDTLAQQKRELHEIHLKLTRFCSRKEE